MSKLKVSDLEMVNQVSEIFLELKKKGLTSEEASNIAAQIGSAAKSASDGHCMRPLPEDLLVDPPIRK